MVNEVIIKLVLAVVLGGLIGYERERRHRPAGFRTIMLICLGSTLVATIASNWGDSGKYIVAAIVTGVGFLGAGTIINSEHNVSGLTTAATVWLIACIGLAIGLGFYIEAILFVLVSYLILEVGGYLEEKNQIKALNKIKDCWYYQRCHKIIPV